MQLKALGWEKYTVEDVRIRVNIYEIQPNMHWTTLVGCGLFHSGIEILGVEVAYGSHEQSGTGVYLDRPQKILPPARLYKTLSIGTYARSRVQLLKILEDISGRWLGLDYDILKNNCNHFTQALLFEITRIPNQLPGYLNRAAKIGKRVQPILAYTPFRGLLPPGPED